MSTVDELANRLQERIESDLLERFGGSHGSYGLKLDAFMAHKLANAIISNPGTTFSAVVAHGVVERQKPPT